MREGANFSQEATAFTAERERPQESWTDTLAQSGERVLKDAFDKTHTIETTLTPEKIGPDTQKGARKKIADKAKAFLRFLKATSLILALGTAIDYRATRYTVTESLNNEGEQVYTHEDPETTHILNVLSGKEQFSTEEKLAFMKEFAAIQCEKLGVETPESLAGMSESELGIFVAQNIMPKFGSSKEDINKYFDQPQGWIDKVEVFPPNVEYNQKVYQALWKIEQTAGAPKVRWLVKRVENEDTNEGKQFNRDHVNPLTNTIYLNPVVNEMEEIVDTAISELAHTKQFHDTPIHSTVNASISGPRILGRALLGRTSLYMAQLQEYETQGSLEHDAHSIIEPKLKAEFEQIKADAVKN